jgi:hypothetical protein
LLGQKKAYREITKKQLARQGFVEDKTKPATEEKK